MKSINRVLAAEPGTNVRSEFINQWKEDPEAPKY